MGKIAVRVTDVRKPPQPNYADAYFTAKIGEEDDTGTFFPLISIRDCELRTSQAGEQYVKYPSKPRIKKIDSDTAAYQKDNDKVIYDPVVDAAMEKGTGDRWFATEGAKKLKDQLARLAVAALAGDGNEASGRGSGAAAPAKAAPAKSRAPAARATAASTGAAEKGSPTAVAEEDDDLPF